MPTRRTSITSDPYLLRTPGTLHRVDTAQLGHRDGVAVGACCTHDCSQGDECPQRKQQLKAPGLLDAGLLRAGVQLFVAMAVFVVLLVAQVVMGKPQDH